MRVDLLLVVLAVATPAMSAAQSASNVAKEGKNRPSLRSGQRQSRGSLNC
jgi:hypothetical protein